MEGWKKRERENRKALTRREDAEALYYLFEFYLFS